MGTDFDNDISSKMYPLTPRWLRVEILKKLSAAFLVVGISIWESYFGTPGIFLQFLLSIDLIVFILLGSLAAISAVAFRGVLQALRSYFGFEYVFTDSGIEYRTDQKQHSLFFLPYSSTTEVSIKRSIMDRMFGYAVLWINPPPWRQRLYSVKDNGSSLALRGLTKNDAAYIAQFIKQKTMPVHLTEAS